MALFGSLQEMSVGDLIQHNCQDAKTGLLTVDSAGKHALIYFRNGAVIHAVMGTVVGEDVVYQALSWTDGKFILEIGTPSPGISIQRNWNSLLLEGARRLDEARQGALTDPNGAGNIRREGILGEILKSYLANSKVFQGALLIDAAGSIRCGSLADPSEQDSLSAIGASALSFARRGLRVANQGKPLYAIFQGETGCIVVWAVSSTYNLVAISPARINTANALEELSRVSSSLVEFL
jgi:predicted regulator of Ras-like GTPase activity (Roadblock/LC7/MglB family)